MIYPPIVLRASLIFSRVNIGNAELYYMKEDLNINSNQFSTAVSLLFVTYITSELPSNLVIKNYVRPSRWISFITTSWGIIATLTGVTQNYAGLIVCRLFLGLVEGGKKSMQDIGSYFLTLPQPLPNRTLIISSTQ